MDVFAIQDKIIESILGAIEQQEAAAIVHKPVAEEQTLVSQVLQGHLNNPDVERGELRVLRKFLQQPLVGASVQQLRKALQTYSSTNDIQVLIEFAKDDPSGDSERELATLAESVKAQVAAVELQEMMGDPEDACGAYIQVQAGEGGTDAADWAEMLLRMYLRWAEDHGLLSAIH